jgi:hypothetical protein
LFKFLVHGYRYSILFRVYFSPKKNTGRNLAENLGQIQIQSKIVRIRNTAIHMIRIVVSVQLPLFFEHRSIHFNSVAEPHHFFAAQAPGKNFDAAPAALAAPAPTLLYSKTKFLNLTKV